MSHFTKLTAQIKDLEALTAAAQKMGFSVEQNTDCRYYFGAERREFVIKLPGAYDIAANKTGNHYSLEADFYGNHVSRHVGPNCSLLMQKYAIEKTRIEALKRGLGVSEKTQNNGCITMTLIDPDSGGQISVECHLGGETEVKTSGFQGQGCMKFRDIEEALGATESFSHTDEFYMPEEEVAFEYARTEY